MSGYDLYVQDGWERDREVPTRIVDVSMLSEPFDIDLRPYSPERVSDRFSSLCAAHAVTRAVSIRTSYLQKTDPTRMSSLALSYWASRHLPPQQRDHKIPIEKLVHAAEHVGVVEESLWPWKNGLILRPPLAAEGGTKTTFSKILETEKSRIDVVRRCLSEGRPVVFGTEAASTWDRYKVKLSRRKLTPITPEPSKLGHVSVLVGYQNGLFIGECSWGESWGLQGFYLASDRLISSPRSGDFWAID